MNRIYQMSGIVRKTGCIAKWSIIFGLFSAQVTASAAVLTVRVFDKSTDIPIAGAVARVVAGPVVSTNATGRLQFSDLEPGVYKLFLSCPGYKDAVIPSLVMASGKERSVIVDLEKGVSNQPQVIPQPADQIVELEEIVVSLLTLDG